MFSQLVVDVASLPLTTRGFITADTRIRRNIIVTHIKANTISAKELAWLISNNFTTPSAELAHAAIDAGNSSLFGVVVNQIKRGWDDVFPSLFRHPAFADACNLKYYGDVETLCRKLEAHGIGATTCSISMPPEACALLRKVRWRINVRRMSTADIQEAAVAQKHASVQVMQEHMVKRAIAKLMMIDSYKKKQAETQKASLQIAQQWVKSVALRRTTRPTHARLFSDASRFGSVGPKSAEIAHVICSMYSEAYVGSAQPAMLIRPSDDSSHRKPWSGFEIAQNARYIVAWPGPLQMAYSALQNEREDWFAAALCMLPPKIEEGKPGWREEANLAGRRIALAILSVGSQKVSSFWTTAATLIMATGHGVKLLCQAGLQNTTVAQNLRFAWGKKDTAAMLAEYVEQDINAEPVIFEMLKTQCIDGRRPLPHAFMLRDYGHSPVREYPLMLAKRLRLPVLNLAESNAIVMAGMCLVRKGLPIELVCEILKRVRRLKVPGSDTVSLSMGATRLGFYNVVF